MIEICIGSACHIKGSYKVIQRMKELLNENMLTEKVELKSSFCLGACGKGVSVRLDGDKIYSIDVEEIDDFFEKRVMGAL